MFNTPVEYLDIRLEQGAAFGYSLAPAWNGFVYVLEGELEEPDAGPGLLIVLEPETLLRARTHVRFVLISGQPWNEPICVRNLSSVE